MEMSTAQNSLKKIPLNLDQHHPLIYATTSPSMSCCPFSKHPSFGPPALGLDLCRSPPQAVGATESPALWLRAYWRHNEVLAHRRVGNVCMQTTDPVVAACRCRLHGFAGLRHLDAATRTWLKELNIDI